MGSKTVALTVGTTKIGKVLADDQGDTLYWYSKDTKDGPSTCTSACLAAWPAVLGKAVAAPGTKLAGQLGSVTDAGGAVQATYNGYPLYTYQADMAPGDTAGNGEGGVWHVITGTALTASSGMAPATPSKSASSGGYGAGYGSGVPVSSGTSSRAAGSGSGSAAHVSATTAPAPKAPASPAPATTAPTPAPAPSSTLNGGGCGEGACW
jgi:predicted lipoprotein with Yx(FWY)xxD motif